MRSKANSNNVNSLSSGATTSIYMILSSLIKRVVVCTNNDSYVQPADTQILIIQPRLTNIDFLPQWK